MTSQPDVIEELAALLSGEAWALADRHAIYGRLRETAPVLLHEDVVYVTRHADVRAVLSDTSTFSSVRGHAARADSRRMVLTAAQQAQADELSEFLGGWMNEKDDPDHARIRGVVQFAFTPRRIATMRDQVQALVDELLAEPDARGEMELVTELAFPLPLTVVCLLLGLGPERHADIRAWSGELAIAFDSGYANLEAAHAAYLAFRDLVTEVIDDRRSDGRTTDLFGALLHGDNGTGLTENELTGMLVLLLFAGHETTTNLIGNSIIAALDHPEQLALLRKDPGLVASSVNEFMRYNGSVHTVRRLATRDSEIGGVPVSAGQTVRLMLAAANRDPRVFDRPDLLDLQRRNSAEHIGFGYGIHRCLGAWLARLETEVAVTTLITRYPELQVVGDVEHHSLITMHGPRHMRLRFH